MGFIASLLSPKIPTMPAPPPPPPPLPDINQIKQDTTRDEALYRKPKGQSSNLLTGALGDTSTPASSGKTLLGQ